MSVPREDAQNSNAKLTELQAVILDGLADDYEDVEQLYIYANRKFAEEEKLDIQSPLMLVHVRFSLREVVDEIVSMLGRGYIEVKYSNDETLAPLHTANFSALHHYWFGATDRGVQLWKAHATDNASNA